MYIKVKNTISLSKILKISFLRNYIKSSCSSQVIVSLK